MFFQKLILVIIFFIIIFNFSKANIPDDIYPDTKTIYVVRLANGDLLTGYIIDMDLNTEGKRSITLQTFLGETVIYEREIASIINQEKYYKYSHRIFLLPTAEPIRNNHFIGAVELLFFYAGFGISDYISVTYGRSLIPNLSMRNQISMFNIKASVYETEWESQPGGMNLAVGTNIGFANHHNRFRHYYSTATFRMERSRFTASIFFKTGGRDIYTIRMPRNEELDMYYADGSFGLALGLDTRFTNWKSLHFIGEIWNINLSQPTDSGVLLGFRIHNSNFSADFGLAFFTQPMVFPVMSFMWAPFN